MFRPAEKALLAPDGPPMKLIMEIMFNLTMWVKLMLACQLDEDVYVLLLSN